MEIIFNQAVTAHKQGRFEEAEKLYRSILDKQPKSPIVRNNLGVLLSIFGRFDEAEISFKKAIELKPDYTEAYNNLGNVSKYLNKLKEAEINYRKAIDLKPDYELAYNNLGNTLRELGRLDEAEISFKKAIELKPNFALSYVYLGNVLRDLDKLDEAEISFKKATEIKPDYALAYNNLGNIMNRKGDLQAGIKNLKQALNIQPDPDLSWHSIYRPLQAIKLKNLSKSIKDYLPFLDKNIVSKYSLAEKSILNYRLSLGSIHINDSLRKVFDKLSSLNNNIIKNPKLPTSELNEELTQPKKITALVHFGRSGTGLLHSLIDGHPEVSTLPSIYFSEFFDHSTWEKVIKGGWEEMADRFTTIYPILFDASSKIKILSKNKKFESNIGLNDGMMNVGPEKNEVLSVDKKVFIKELKRLMDCYKYLDAAEFFKLIHSAHDKTLNDHKEKSLIFYHIHHPDTYAQLNFLRLVPDANWLMMVREPLQSCESWVKKSFYNNDYMTIASGIFQMLFDLDQAIYQNENSVGVRLEDLKEHPKKTIQALCSWLGIKEEDSLYEMTAQGKRWWGCPASPDYKKDGMNAFGKTSINRKLGYVFSENDQYILRTLFYPFSVRFGYAEENLEKFKNDLQIIRPMLDQMFDFEIKISQNKKINIEKFMKSGPYLYLRSGMIERWNTLNKFHTYPNMLIPIKIN